MRILGWGLFYLTVGLNAIAQCCNWINARVFPIAEKILKS